MRRDCVEVCKFTFKTLELADPRRKEDGNTTPVIGKEICTIPGAANPAIGAGEGTSRRILRVVSIRLGKGFWKWALLNPFTPYPSLRIVAWGAGSTVSDLLF